jgi:hypothetical protein
MDSKVRSNSYKMRVVIVNGFPQHLDLEDKTGLKHFKKALNSILNFGALLNVIDTFGVTAIDALSKGNF